MLRLCIVSLASLVSLIYMPHDEKISFSKMRSVFFMGLILVLSVAMLYLFRPFFYPIFWAAVLAVMFYPHYHWLNSFIKMPTLSSVITVVVVFVTIFLPLTLISILIVNESVGLYTSVTREDLSANVQDVASWLKNSRLEPYVAKIQHEWNDYAASATEQVGSYLFAKVTSITQNSLRFVFMLFIMFYSLFFFFKDGKGMLRRLMHVSPLGDTYEEMLYNRFTSTARATLKSTVIVGSIQGLLGGILFWITGIEGALVWGVIMAALSFIPAIGSFLVWFPAGIVMLALGNVWQGVTILLVGSLVISTIDNLIRPPLIGKDIQMHPLLVLFSTLGGVALFNISGFIIGPIIASLYLAIMTIYEHYYEHELGSN